MSGPKPEIVLVSEVEVAGLRRKLVDLVQHADRRGSWSAYMIVLTGASASYGQAAIIGKPVTVHPSPWVAVASVALVGVCWFMFWRNAKAASTMIEEILER